MFINHFIIFTQSENLLIPEIYEIFPSLYNLFNSFILVIELLNSIFLNNKFLILFSFKKY
jgi:hypothetical protein